MKRTIYLIAFITLAIFSTSAQKHTSRVDKNLTIYNDVLRQLDLSYADTLNIDELVTTSIHQMLRKIDPYTIYIPEEKSSDLKMMTTGKYGGIGAMIMQRQDSFPPQLEKYCPKSAAKRYVMISEPYEGQPAQKNNVYAGDILIEVDGTNVIGKTTSEVSSLLRGTPGTNVTLKILRYGNPKPITISFERQEVKLPPVSFYTVLGQHNVGPTDKRIGYIIFTEFTEGSANEFAAALKDLYENEHIESLIIDIRGNGGGIIDEAVQIMSLFVPKGTEIVSTKGKNSKNDRTYRTTINPLYPDLPIIVLVDKNSASASEIVAGAFQDLDRATLIGTRTYGKGLVQSIRSIAYNGHLKVTTAKYYIPSGRCIQAIDYSKRGEDGSVERVPDSLTHEFKTAKGRIVRDGGGIEPDIIFKDSISKVDINYSLYIQNQFVDFATQYFFAHPTIVPVDEFELTDNDIEQFIDFLKERKFEYQTETSKMLDDVIEMAKLEDIDDNTMSEIKTLQNKLKPSFETAIWKHKDEVKRFLSAEIIQRYYFQKGYIISNLKHDTTLKRALEEL